MMRIYSGSCCFCDVGLPTDETDERGNKLFSGDIVQLWHGNYIGEDFEEWLPSSGLTAIVGRQYARSPDGTLERIEGPTRLFTMGIADCGIQGEEWKVVLVKSHRDIIHGERFLDFGFNYRDDK
jgi:hypothetical protein